MYALAESNPITRPRPRLRRVPFLREIINLLVLIGAIYALVNLATVRFVVQGTSMIPSFQEDEFLIISRVNYLLDNPERGDVVVFHYPRDPSDDYIKRVVGMPGETVEIRDTLIYIDGMLLDEPYIREPCTPQSCRDEAVQLGPDEYFMMGDNRNGSQDSRRFGPVNFKYFVGEVVLRYWPPSEWAFVNGLDYPGE